MMDMPALANVQNDNYYLFEVHFTAMKIGLVSYLRKQKDPEGQG